MAWRGVGGSAALRPTRDGSAQLAELSRGGRPGGRAGPFHRILRKRTNCVIWGKLAILLDVPTNVSDMFCFYFKSHEGTRMYFAVLGFTPAPPSTEFLSGS